MSKYILIVLLVLLLIFVIVYLAQNNKGNDQPIGTEESTLYKRISAKEAKKIIDEQSDYVILDVRTKEEYIESHIKNAILIPDYEINTRIENELPNKDKLILVYCRSGRRSANAAKEIIDLGYTNVIDFGGIIDWPYETES